VTLNTPLLWVLFPLVIAAIVGALYQRKALSIILTVITAFGLALLAALFPENLTLSIGPLRLVFSENLAILGRQITVKYEILPFISLIYAMTGLWTLSSWFPNTPVAFRPISLVLTALLTAAAGVEPFLYAAVLIQIAILVSVPMLSQGGGATDRGILRYLTLQTLAMPLILLAGWLLTGVETLPADSPLVGQSTILLGLGFALWLGIFPFHSWIPMVAQRSRPNVVGFLVFLFPNHNPCLQSELFQSLHLPQKPAKPGGNAAIIRCGDDCDWRLMDSLPNRFEARLWFFCADRERFLSRGTRSDFARRFELADAPVSP